jgi:hypothetical protein
MPKDQVHIIPMFLRDAVLGDAHSLIRYKPVGPS